MKKLLRISSVLTLVIFLFGAGNTIAQVGQVTVSVSFESGEDPSSPGDTVDILVISTTVGNISNLGGISVFANDDQEGVPVGKVTQSIGQLYAANAVSGSTAYIRFYAIDPFRDYTITTTITNDRGGRLPLITTNYDAQ